MRRLTRILSILMTAMMLVAGLSLTAHASAEDIPYNAFADYGQQTFDIPASTGIKIDGVVSEGEYACAPIEVNEKSEGMTWLDWTKEGFPEEEIPEILPYSIKYYVTYDAEALYVAAEIVEASLYTSCSQVKDIWGLDSLEIDISVDACGDIPAGTYSQSSMLDRIRVTYALWDDGSGALTPVGICYTPSSYGTYQVNDEMDGEGYMITRNEDKQLTTYEMKFYWEDLYMDNKVPGNVFMNFQLHLGDGRYLEYVQDGYIGCLGGLRYAGRLTSEEAAELGTDKTMAPHIFNLTDAAKLNGDAPADTTAAETNAATEAPTEEPGDETAAPAPDVTDTGSGAATEVGTSAQTQAPAEKGCGAVVSMSAVAVLAAAAAAVALKKKD